MTEQDRKLIKTGKIASYTFASILTLFLVWEFLSADRRGEAARAHIYFPSVMLIGASLGININAADVGKIVLSMFEK